LPCCLIRCCLSVAPCQHQIIACMSVVRLQEGLQTHMVSGALSAPNNCMHERCTTARRFANTYGQHDVSVMFFFPVVLSLRTWGRTNKSSKGGVCLHTPRWLYFALCHALILRFDANWPRSVCAFETALLCCQRCHYMSSGSSVPSAVPSTPGVCERIVHW
jgi:hypothetical protein